MSFLIGLAVGSLGRPKMFITRAPYSGICSTTLEKRLASYYVGAIPCDSTIKKEAGYDGLPPT